MVICVKMSDVQTQLYKSFLESDSIRKNVLGMVDILFYFDQLIWKHFFHRKI